MGSPFNKGSSSREVGAKGERHERVQHSCFMIERKSDTRSFDCAEKLGHHAGEIYHLFSPLKRFRF